jgi:predicted RNA methylase
MFLAAPFVPTSRKTVRKMIEAAELDKKDIVYDLGSGDGRLVIAAARKKVKKAVGFEINPLLNIYASIKAKILRLKNTTFITRSIWNSDLSKCNKLFVYLMPNSMNRLESKILSEMKEGSYIISHSFRFPNMEPIREIDDKVRVYKVIK